MQKDNTNLNKKDGNGKLSAIIGIVLAGLACVISVIWLRKHSTISVGGDDTETVAEITTELYSLTELNSVNGIIIMRPAASGR